MSQAEKIRCQYLDYESNKMDQLKKLDNNKNSWQNRYQYFRYYGALVMGGGILMIMLNGNMTIGLLLSILGMLIALSIYSIYKLSTYICSFKTKILPLSKRS